MSEVRRYGAEIKNSGTSPMFASVSGQWVHWDDHSALAADLASAVADKEAYGQNAIDLRKQRDEGLAREAELRVKIESKDRLIEQGFKTLDRVHCMWAKRLLDATGIPSQVLIPDEEFVKYFEELKGLKQRLDGAEKLLNRWGNMFAGGIAASQLEDLRNDNSAFLASPGCADGEKPCPTPSAN